MWRSRGIETLYHNYGVNSYLTKQIVIFVSTPLKGTWMARETFRLTKMPILRWCQTSYWHYFLVWSKSWGKIVSVIFCNVAIVLLLYIFHHFLKHWSKPPAIQMSYNNNINKIITLHDQECHPIGSAHNANSLQWMEVQQRH